MRASLPTALAAGTYLLIATATVPSLVAQDVEMLGRMHGVRPPPGYYETLARNPNAYRFEKVWKEIARRVQERRRALIEAGDYATLNAHFRPGGPSRVAAQASAAAVAGTFRFPVLVGYFADSTHIAQPDTGTLNTLIFGTATPPPYSVATFYSEMSNGLLTIQGDVIGWFRVDSASTYYEGSNNGLDPTTDNTGDFIEELLRAADPTVDYSVYDGDGDGFIDLVAVLHPLSPGECGSPHIWSHRSVIGAWGNSFTGDGVSARDYMIQSAVGGTSGCDSTQAMAIGTFSHELGHGLTNLPDLYDTGPPPNPPATQGIGHWGLMGSGNWNTPTSPAHMEAWSKEELGWVAVQAVDSTMGAGTYLLNPVVTSDTVLRVNVLGTSEYFLLENRQPLGSDANLHGPGLLIWHVDSDLIAARRSSNTVNAIFPHGLDLEQADGQDHLGNNINRGDAGDPYPGSTSNTVFGPSTAPNSELNDNSASGVQIDSITMNPDLSIAFRLNFNIVNAYVSTSVGPGTAVIVDGVTQPAPYEPTWAFPSTHTIAVDSIQGDTLIRHLFLSWSDGGAISHSVNISDAVPDTFVANLQTQHRLRVTWDLGGTVSSSQPLDVNGIAWLFPTDMATLVATPAAADQFFVEWTGDTTSVNDTLVLTMARPYTVHAVFGPAVAIQTTALVNGVMGAGYVDTLSATGGSGAYTWSQTGGDSLPPGLALNAATGVISGVPEQDGAFRIVFRAVSGALSAEDTVSLTVTRPSLVLDDVVSHLLSPVSVLTPDEERFLDLIGNNNGRFDIGDFRAYLQDQGLATDVVPATLLKGQGKARKEEGR